MLLYRTYIRFFIVPGIIFIYSSLYFVVSFGVCQRGTSFVPHNTYQKSIQKLFYRYRIAFCRIPNAEILSSVSVYISVAYYYIISCTHEYDTQQALSLLSYSLASLLHRRRNFYFSGISHNTTTNIYYSCTLVSIKNIKKPMPTST